MPAGRTSTTQPDYFTGEFLTVADYAAEQAHQIAIQRAGAVALNDYGLVRGLRVTMIDGAETVGAGLAIDRAGRLLLLTDALAAPPRPADATVLAIVYAETMSAAPTGAVGTVTEAPRLVWAAAAAALDDDALVLGTGTPLTAAGRRYAGMAAGTLVLAHPAAGQEARITGWSAPPLLGLRIDADPLEVAPMSGDADAAGVGRIVVRGGTLGVGTLSAQAHLDVLAPVVALDGPGRISSFDKVVRGTSMALDRALHVGDLVMTTDRDGRPTQATVLSVTAANEVITDAPLNCLDATFHYDQALAASIRGSGGGAALTVGRDGLVGLGVDVPAAQLHLGAGDLQLATDGATIAFAGDGTVATADHASLIRFDGRASATDFEQRGTIRWLPGRDAAPPPVGMTLDAQGHLGIGAAPTDCMLTVAGAMTVQSLMFPDGSVQQTAMCAVPIGAVIDWWQGAATNMPPENFMICSGGRVDHHGSPFDGMLVPNLSGQFLYGLPAPGTADPDGGKIVDGLGESRGTESHHHAFATPVHLHDFPHTHPDIHDVTDQANNTSGYWGTSNYNAVAHHTHDWSGTVGTASTLQTAANADVGKQIVTDDATTLPPYVALLKLIRIW